MKTFAIGSYDVFHGETKVHIVESSTPELALIEVVRRCTPDADENYQIEWRNGMVEKTVEEIIDMSAQGELCLSEPLKIKG